MFTRGINASSFCYTWASASFENQKEEELLNEDYIQLSRRLLSESTSIKDAIGIFLSREWHVSGNFLIADTRKIAMVQFRYGREVRIMVPKRQFIVATNHFEEESAPIKSKFNCNQSDYLTKELRTNSVNQDIDIQRLKMVFARKNGCLTENTVSGEIMDPQNLSFYYCAGSPDSSNRCFVFTLPRNISFTREYQLNQNEYQLTDLNGKLIKSPPIINTICNAIVTKESKWDDSLDFDKPIEISSTFASSSNPEDPKDPSFISSSSPGNNLKEEKKVDENKGKKKKLKK